MTRYVIDAPQAALTIWRWGRQNRITHCTPELPYSSRRVLLELDGSKFRGLHGCRVRCDPFFPQAQDLGRPPLHRGRLQTRALYRRSAGAKYCALTQPLIGPFCTCTQSACRLVTLSRVPFSAIARTLPFGEGEDRIFTLGGCTRRISSLRARPVLSDPVGNAAAATF